ncbi:MAG: hydrogenase small subunit [Candidatus Nezhaarchaeota archaeon]|nr:hydrogenase small subunit [Candidatus Nezhaarchaeota archaeon]
MPRQGMGISRRDFIRTVTFLGATAALEALKPDVVHALESAAKGEVPIAWVQGAGCTGCTISLLQSSDPDLVEAITWFRLNLMFHPTVMIEPQHDPHGALKKLREFPDGGYLIVEGAIPKGNYCVVGKREDKTPISFEEWVERLGRKASVVLAVGTCASYGGIPAGYPNPTGCVGVADFFSKRRIGTPVVNIPGCPPHPDWMLLTIALVILGHADWVLESLDEYGRPSWFYPDYIHNLCPRRQHFDNLEIADAPGEQGIKCLWKIGCRGPIAKADCSVRKWNNGVNFCISAGAPCIGCCEPDFPGKEPRPKGFYEHVANPNVGSPKVFSQPFKVDLRSLARSEESNLGGALALRPLDIAALASMGIGLAALLARSRSRRVKEVEEGG